MYCSHCGTSKKGLSLCGDCKDVAYCSRKCQVKDYSKHIELCGAREEEETEYGPFNSRLELLTALFELTNYTEENQRRLRRKGTKYLVGLYYRLKRQEEEEEKPEKVSPILVDILEEIYRVRESKGYSANREVYQDMSISQLREELRRLKTEDYAAFDGALFDDVNQMKYVKEGSFFSDDILFA